MSESTAVSLGLAKGDCVVISTDKGEARFKLDTIRMRDGLINADYGWWHPEWMTSAPYDGGMWESNVNCLTSCSLDQSEPMIGTWSYNAIDCMIRKDDGGVELAGRVLGLRVLRRRGVRAALRRFGAKPQGSPSR